MLIKSSGFENGCPVKICLQKIFNDLVSFDCGDLLALGVLIVQSEVKSKFVVHNLNIDDWLNFLDVRE